MVTSTSMPFSRPTCSIAWSISLLMALLGAEGKAIGSESDFDFQSCLRNRASRYLPLPAVLFLDDHDPCLERFQMSDKVPAVLQGLEGVNDYQAPQKAAIVLLGAEGTVQA